MHSLVTKGAFVNTLKKQVTVDIDAVAKKSGTQDQLQGMLGYINLVDTQSRQKASAKEQKDRVITSELMYQNFLIYKWFYAAPVPTILCEGITDNIYLQHAIRSRAKQFPHFVSKATDGSVKLNVRFFRYPQAKERKTTSTGKILGLSGGSSNVGNFLLNYRETIKGFHEHKNMNPVVVLLDNDKGILPIMSILKEIIGSHQDRDAEFLHVVGNLYVIATKRIKDQPSKIEDFFRTADKKDLGNKKFNDSNDHNTETEYGKFDFATKVVRPNARTIDFSGFDELLTTISNVIQHRSSAVVVKP